MRPLVQSWNDSPACPLPVQSADRPSLSEVPIRCPTEWTLLSAFQMKECGTVKPLDAAPTNMLFLGAMHAQFQRLSIGQKLFLAMAVLAGVAVLVSVIGLNSLRTLNARLNAVVDVSAEKAKLAARVKQDLLSITRAEKNIILSDRPEEWDAYAAFIDQTRAEMQERRAQLRDLAGESGKQQLDRFAATWDQWLAVDEQVRAFVRSNAQEQARKLSTGEGRTLADKCEALLTAIVDKNDADMSNDRRVSDGNYASTQLLVLLLSGAGLLAGGGLAFFVVRGITHHIGVLSTYARTVEATQDLSHPVPLIAEDEIGQLGRSFDAMRQSLSEAQEQQRRLAAIVANSNDAVVVSNPKGTITAWNRGAERMYGYTEDEALAMHVQDLVPEEKQEEMQQFTQALHGGEPVESFETQRLTKDGRTLDIELTVTRLSDQAGQSIVIATIERDITERKQFEQRLEQLVEKRTTALRAAQEQLVKQERLATLGQLAGSVAHEIRNPLGVIKNATYFLKEVQPDDGDEDIQESFEEIERGLANSDRIIRELLDYTRDPKTEHVTYALNDVIEQAMKDVEIPATVQLEKALAQGECHVHGDPGQMERLVGNLARNAVQAMPDGGALTVRSLSQNGHVCIEVADTGSGIAPEDLEKIFEPLYTKKAKGIGLGLAVSRRYAELNQGRLEVESQLGKGATFRVTLPLSSVQVLRTRHA